MKRLVVIAVGMILMTLPQLARAGWGDLFGPFGGNGWVNLAWFDVGAPIPTAVSSHHQSPHDRVTVAVDTGGGELRFVRFLGDGGSDTSFGFLGRTDVVVPGASYARVVRMLHQGSTTWVVGDAELADGRWIVVFPLDEDGTVLDDEMGNPWFIFSRATISNVEAFASDAVLHHLNAQVLLEIVGWIDHQVLMRDYGLRIFLDLSAGGTDAGITVSSGSASSERWLHLAPVYHLGTVRCSAILGESDGLPRVYLYDSGEAPTCGTPISFQPTLSGAPGAILRPQGIAAVPVDGDTVDVVAAVWVESGLVTKPTAYFRTAGLTSSWRATWGSGGIAFVDSANGGYIGFRGGRVFADYNNESAQFEVISVGHEIGTGGEFGTAHRIRPIRLRSNGTLDPKVATVSHTTNTTRHHQVRDLTEVTGTRRLAVAVSSHVKTGFDVPAARVVMFQGPDDLFFDGFESGNTSAWSTSVP